MFGKQKTLIIDHNSERNNRIKNYLDQDHFICYQAKTLDELNSLYTNNNYDCIILEDVFPGINTNKFLVKNRRNSQAITIVVSDMLNEAYLEDLLDAGADDYIVVPFSLTSLLRKITIIVGKPLYTGAVLVQSSLVGRSSGNMQTPIPTVRLRTKVDKYHAEPA